MKAGKGTPAAAIVAFDQRVLGLLGALFVAFLGLLLFAQLPTVLSQDVVIPKLLVLRFSTFLLLLLLAVLLGAAGLYARRMSLRPPLHLLAGGLFLLWLLVAALSSRNPAVSLYGGVLRYEGWLGYASYFIVFATARVLANRDVVPGRGLLAGFSVAILLVSALAVVQHFWPASSPVGLLSLGDWQQRSFATFGNPLFLALFGCLVAPILLALAVEVRSFWGRAAVGAALLLLMVATVFTYSRAGWVGLVLGLAAAAVLLFRSKRAALATLALLVLLAFGGATLADRVRSGEASPEATVAGRVASTAEGGGSLEARLELYRGSVPLILERPVLGWGLETYTTEGARVRTERLVQIEPGAFADRPHNSLLYLAYSSGLVGLVLYLFFWAGALLAGFSNWRSLGPSRRWMSAGLLGGLAGYFVAELGSFSVIEATPFAWAALGWVSASRNGGSAPESAAHSAPGSGSAAGKIALAVAVVVALAALVSAPLTLGHAVRVARADRLHHVNLTGTHDMREFDSLAARQEKAAELDPYNPYIWNVLGSLYIDAGQARGNRGYFALARESFSSGLEYNPLDANLTVSLSDLEIRDGRPDAAIRLLNEYLERDPYLEDAHFNLGLAYAGLGRFGEAARHFEECVRLVPSDAEAFYYLSQVYSQLGEQERSREALHSAQRLDPEGDLSLPPAPPPPAGS